MKGVMTWSLVVMCAFTVSTFAQSRVVFDNQSGEPAVVKLLGPTQSQVEVPNGAKVGADAAAGRYIIKVRYGKLGAYRYSKGDEFDVRETATERSEVTITLHKVMGGNYESCPMSPEEFAEGQRPPATKETATTTPASGKNNEELKLAILDSPDRGVAIKDVRVVALDKEISYAGLVQGSPSGKVLQLTMTVEGTKSRICLGARSGQQKDEDCLPFSSLLVCTDAKGSSVISMAECIGAMSLQKAVPPDGHINLVHLGDAPHSWKIDAFFSVPENAAKVTFRFTGSPSSEVLTMPAKAEH
jgi:hypothetical protein